MNPATVGKKLKEIYPDGIAKDGRSYAEISDAEIGSMFILKNGDKGITSLGLSTTSDNKEAGALRKEFTQKSKELGFQDMQKSWNKVQNADKNAAGDLTVIYSYIKALDPTSVVREGEINLTKAAESIPSNILRAYERAKEGRVMSPQLRAKMAREVGLMYNERAEKQQELNAFYEGLAKDSGADPQKVVGGIGKVETAKLPEEIEEEKQGIQGPLGAILSGGKIASDYLFPETKKLPQNIIETLTNQRVRQSARPGTKGDLGASTKAAFDETVAVAPDVLKTAVGPAFELASALGLPALTKTAGRTAVRGGKAVISNLSPFKFVGKQRTAAANALDEAGNFIDETKIAEDLMDFATNKAPLSMKKSAEKYALQGIDRFQNTKASFVDTLVNLAESNDAAFLESGKAGRAAASKIEKVVGDSIRKQIAEKAPDVQAANKAFEALYKGKKTVGKNVARYGPVALLGKLLGGGF